MIALIKGLTPVQWFLVILALLGALGGATAQLTDLFGPSLAHAIVTGSSLISTILSSIMVPLTGQGAQIRAVDAMPGVQKIVVNEQANSTLATIAVDPQSKVEATPASAVAVAATAKAAE